ncbi:MAG: hypothetical protein IPN70_00505 [Candidatus Moraniibacteriota bacterium]|nr:MAG: hypothetical protein IPN70_00505 [Candidatus Moranbacteria bacterium]
MDGMRIGIQGDKGSTNERACFFFATKYGWKNSNIQYLITTENVLKSLERGDIQYGTFAWKSSRSGFVAETQKAIQKYSFEKVDEQDFQLDHALLSHSVIDIKRPVIFYSHPQALKEHKIALQNMFSQCVFREASDTALAAKNLRDGKYEKNSLVIAPLVCATLYDLDIFSSNLPSNVGYMTTIYLVKKRTM